MDKLISKVIKDAEERAEEIAREAEEELEEKLAAKKKEVEEDFDMKLKAAKSLIEKNSLMEIANKRLTHEKELLAIKNSYVENVLEKLESNFGKFLTDDMEQVLSTFTGEIGDMEYTVTIPDNDKIEIDETRFKKIIRDKSIQNGIKIETADWDLFFNWQKVEDVIGEELRKLVAKKLFDSDEQD